VGRDAADPGLTSAHRVWDARWASEPGRAAWLQPAQMVRDVVERLRERDLRTVLDLGCGPGRHARFLAEHGFRCWGLDASPNGIAYARETARGAGLDIAYREGPFLGLPFEDATFGCVIAWNVIYHGDGDVVREALAGIRRVLQPNGIYVGTMLSTRSPSFGRGVEVRPNTFVVPDSEDDKAHPHFYCDAPELLALHEGFDVLELRNRVHGSGNHHWECTLEKR
jgi:SAM-dependent methyltransferase